MAYEHDGYEHTVDTHINRRQTKVESDPILQLHGSDSRLVQQPEKGAVFRFSLGNA